MTIELSSETIAICLATLLGPVFAVLITRWQDNRRAKYDRRHQVYRTQMATRAQNISQDHVGALNLIEVDFHNVKSVVTAWQNYINHLNTRPVGSDPSGLPKWRETQQDLLAILLSKIASEMGYAKGEIEIRNGGYAPEGWEYRDKRSGLIQEYLLDLARGRKGIPVVSLDPPPAQTPNRD